MSYDHFEYSWKYLKDLTYVDSLSAEVLKSSTLRKILYLFFKVYMQLQVSQKLRLR